MTRFVGIAALASVALASPADSQFHGGTPLERAAAAYGECVYGRARAARQGGSSADAAIASGFSRCKSERKRALKAIRSRMAAAGLGGADARVGAQSMIDSGDRMMADTLRKEFAAGSGAVPK